VKEHAEKVFPKNNVKCVTAHSIAFRKWGFRFAKKLTSNLKPIDIIDSDLLTETKTMDQKSLQVYNSLNFIVGSR
jgi:hypothetical protein